MENRSRLKNEAIGKRERKGGKESGDRRFCVGLSFDKLAEM